MTGEIKAYWDEETQCFKEYNDEFDITIHFETEEDRNKFLHDMEFLNRFKEAIGKIKEEIELVTKFGNSFQPIEHGLLFSIIDKHTEGLV